MSNNLMHFDPFHEMTRFDSWRGLGDFFRDTRLRSALRDVELEPRIKLEVTETEQAYTVKAEIPGAKKEDIKIDIDGNRVSISAETKMETEKREDQSVVRSEFYYGQQYRSFTLAHEIDNVNAEAKYQDGVLKLLLPKRAGTSSKKLVVS